MEYAAVMQDLLNEDMQGESLYAGEKERRKEGKKEEEKKEKEAFKGLGVCSRVEFQKYKYLSTIGAPIDSEVKTSCKGFPLISSPV